MQRTKFLLPLLLVFVCVVSSLFLVQFIFDAFGDRDSFPSITAEEEKMREYWRNEIQLYPADVVYRNFIDSYSAQDENGWHGAMHILASLLYERYGLEALQFCDESFQQACYHELMSSFAFEGKATQADEISDLCGKDWNCLHGVGHGLVMYYGYDQETLSATLSKCPQEHQNFIEGCQSGMFMEFITRTMGSSRGEIQKSTHQVDQNFCLEVELAYRDACHFVMVESIVARADQSQKDITASVNEYCLESAKGFEDACFKGAGFNIKFLTQNPSEGIALCEVVSGGHEEYRDTCLTTLAMQYSFFKKREISEEICDAVSTWKKDKCLVEIL
jgi:hypothetical protein